MKGSLGTCLFFSLCAAAGIGCSSDTSSGTSDGSSPTDMATNTDGPTSTMDMAQQAPPTEFLVMRVGTGTAAMQTNQATAAFIERHKISDGSMVGQATALPVAASGAMHSLTLSGNGASEGALTLSADGHYVLFAGYDATPGTTLVVDNADRVVGRLSAGGTVDTSTVVTGLNGTGNFIRSATSTDGNALWLGGVLGVAYTTLGKNGAATARPLGSTANSRVVAFYGGQLYVSRASDTVGGISSVGTGAPMADNVTAKQLTGFPTTGNVLSPYGFVAFDRDATQGIDLLYVADDRTDTNGGIQRWKLSGTTWSMNGTLSAGATSGCRGLAAFASGSDIVLIATTSEAAGSTRIVSFTDSGGVTTTVTPKVLATAATNTAYRGVSLPPQ